MLDYKSALTKFEPEKSLVTGRIRANGRNHHGVITAKHRGGGNKRLYRIIDFKRNGKDGMVANVEAIEYDPNRSVHIALIKYEDGIKAYILCPNGLRSGAKVVSGPDSPPEIGQLSSAGEYSDGLGDSQHRDESRAGRQAGSVGRRRGAAGGARRGMGGDYSAVAAKCGGCEVRAGRPSDNWGIWTGST